MLLDKVAASARISPNASDNNKEAYFTINSNFKINIQPASAEFTALVDGGFGLTFRGYTTYSGLQMGDQITISGTVDKYTVHGISDWNQLPLPHYELVLFKGDE